MNYYMFIILTFDQIHYEVRFILFINSFTKSILLLMLLQSYVLKMYLVIYVNLWYHCLVQSVQMPTPSNTTMYFGFSLFL